MTPLEELRRLAPPPAVPVLAAAVDPPVPTDYPALLEAYGMGEFCDLVFLQPGPEDVMDYERETRDEDPEDYPHPVHPEPGGLLPWGGTSNGQLLCWLTAGEPDTWPVVVWDLKCTEFEEHPMGATAFLAGWLAGRVESELLSGVFREHSQWFTAAVERSFVSVRLSPHSQSLDVLRSALGDAVLRRSSGDQHIVAAGEWRVTYNPGDLEIAFPPGDLDAVREAAQRIAAALGCEIVSTTDFEGEPV